MERTAGRTLKSQTTVAYDEPRMVPLAEVARCDVWTRLDELDVAIENTNQSILSLRNRLTGITNNVEYDTNVPICGPRSSNSNLEGRICAQADFVEDLNRMVGDIIDRLTV